MSGLAAQRQPAIFSGHGSPMNALESNRRTRAWRASGEAGAPARVLQVISAHWYAGELAVTAMARPRTIHDFGGFPPAPCAMRYPAPGDPVLAARVRELLAPLPVRLDHEWGLDHGTWSVPTPDHYLPMLAILGARLPGDRVRVLTEGIDRHAVVRVRAAGRPAPALNARLAAGGAPALLRATSPQPPCTRRPRASARR